LGKVGRTGDEGWLGFRESEARGCFGGDWELRAPAGELSDIVETATAVCDDGATEAELGSGQHPTH
jgi:hypothetical protein